jgi:FkbM family methyltransferase
MDPKVFEGLVNMFSRGLIRTVKCINGKLFVNDVEVNNINDVIHNIEIWSKILGWKYDGSCNCWIKNGIKFRRIYDSIFFIFEGKKEYSNLNVENRVVVDIGAFVGDSAIYFILRGAKKVIAIEPHPEAYKEMLENTKLNNLENVIIPINAGLASKTGKIAIEDVNVEGTSTAYHKPSNCNGTVPTITLSELISKFGIDDSAVLKMDCEGCEYDVILNDYEHVKVFKELIFEYHAHAVGKPMSKLLKVLAKDYQCKIIRGNESVGIIYCIKR